MSNGPTPFDLNGNQSFQCAELSARFLFAVYGIHTPNGIQRAEDLVNRVAAATGIPVGTPGPGSVPAPGDVVSFGTDGFADHGVGHTAVVTSSNPSTGTFTVMSQNFGPPPSYPEGYGGQQTLQVDLTGGHNGKVSFLGRSWTTTWWLEVATSDNHPTVAVWPWGTRNPAGQQDVFWKGWGNNGLWEAVWSNPWRGPSSIPGINTVGSSPSAVVNSYRNEEDIAWQGTDNQLWYQYWNGQWHTAHVIGGMGPLGSSPSVAAWPAHTLNTPGQQDIFWKGWGNNGLWEAIWNNGWHGPSSVPGVGNVASSPSALANQPGNQEDIFWEGTDGQLWEIFWAGRWYGPYRIGMGPLGSSPTVAVWPSGTRNPAGQQDVFWKGSGNNGLWEAIWNGRAWQGPSPVPGVNNVASAPSAVVNAPGNQEDIFWKGTDNQLWEIFWAGQWYGPYNIGMGPLG